MTGYRVSRGPHGLVWWAPEEVIPPTYDHEVRPAHEEEIVLMQQIEENKGLPLASMGMRLGELMDERHAADRAREMGKRGGVG